MSKNQDQAITLTSQLCVPKSTCFFQGALVPWELKSYQEEFSLAQSKGGLFDLTDHVVIEIHGKDAEDYLQRMTTVQFKGLGVNQVVHGAFLTGRGGVVALGVFHKIDSETFHFLISLEKKERVLEHIEQFHFAEQFSVRDLAKEYAVLGIWNPKGVLSHDLGLNDLTGPLSLQRVECWGEKLLSWKDVRRSSLFWTVMDRSRAVFFLKKWLENGHFLLGRRLFEFFRLEAAVPWSGNELSEKDIILEGNFNEAVARNKGCYPGQEVVERIFTYGQVNRKLQRVTLWGDSDLDSSKPLLFFADSKEVGELVSWMEDPRDEKIKTGLMFVKKEFWSSQQEWRTTSGVCAKLSPIS